MPKYYAVKVGRQPGIYTTWEECKSQVNGYSGAIYKSFATLQEAKVFMGDNSNITSNNQINRSNLSTVQQINTYIPQSNNGNLPTILPTKYTISQSINSNIQNSTQIKPQLIQQSTHSQNIILNNTRSNNLVSNSPKILLNKSNTSRVLKRSSSNTINFEEINVYTDGSHQREIDYLGIGAWTSYKNKEYELSKECDQKLLLEYGITETTCSNPTAEFIAFSEILKTFVNVKNSNIRLIFNCDYNGVEKWMTGEWKTNESYIRKIKETCVENMKLIPCQIEIRWVKGHSCNKGNDNADRLAGDNLNYDTFPELIQLLQ